MANPFDQFIEQFTRLMDEAENDEPRILEQGGRLLETLVATDNWLPDAYAQPHPEYYQQYLLHKDAQNRFSVVSFVWGPGQKTPIHDHTVWGLIGMLRGAETETSYTLGTATGQAPQLQGSTRLTPGMVGKVSPTIGDVHKVANAYDDRVSISIHVYGADIGQVTRHVFDAHTGAAKSFVSGYANA